MLDRFRVAVGQGAWRGRLLLIGALVVAYFIGTLRPMVAVHTAVPSSAEGAISVEADGWTYSVPLDGVEWFDSTGAMHDAGRPDCLPVGGTTRAVTFGSVEVTHNGGGWRAVVWVDCRS
jgi:hypothetical protein